MTTAKALSKFVQDNQKKLAKRGIFLPVKTALGIELGPVVIHSEENIKNIFLNNELIYREICLNDVAISLAKMILLKYNTVTTDRLWLADQDYGKFRTQSNFLLYSYQRANERKDYDKADSLYARYEMSKIKAIEAKNKALGLCLR
jgi:hypothetical protein